MGLKCAHAALPERAHHYWQFVCQRTSPAGQSSHPQEMPTLPQSPTRPARPPAPLPQQTGISNAIPLLRRRRTAILTGAVVITTVAGTLIGAVLKSRQQVEAKQTARKETEADTREQIASLESARGALVAQKAQIEMKVRELRGRQERLKKGEVKVEGGRERERTGIFSGPRNKADR